MGEIMNSKTFKRLEIAGGAVVFAIASFLHFFYNLSGKSAVGALLGSVNESVWEHLKIFAIAYTVWAATELLWTKPSLKEFVWAKAAGVYFLCLSIASFFYIYTTLFGRSVLFIDLTSGLTFSFLAHLISYKLMNSEKNRGQFFLTGTMMFFLLFIMILCFTFYPPKTKLFEDPVTKTYGIRETSFDEGAIALETLYMP